MLSLISMEHAYGLIKPSLELLLHKSKIVCMRRSYLRRYVRIDGTLASMFRVMETTAHIHLTHPLIVVFVSFIFIDGVRGKRSPKSVHITDKFNADHKKICIASGNNSLTNYVRFGASRLRRRHVVIIQQPLMSIIQFIST